MKTWREKALETLPNLSDLIDAQDSPMNLWIELFRVMVMAYEREPIDEETIGKIYDYAAWTFEQPSTGSAATDPSSAVAVAFIEDIPMNQKISEDLHRWMSTESFDDFENLFRYTLNDEEWATFSSGFRERKKQYFGPTRI
jgi:hypothetical protein